MTFQIKLSEEHSCSAVYFTEVFARDPRLHREKIKFENLAAIEKNVVLIVISTCVQ